jgi:hypothetical protein
MPSYRVPRRTTRRLPKSKGTSCLTPCRKRYWWSSQGILPFTYYRIGWRVITSSSGEEVDATMMYRTQLDKLTKMSLKEHLRDHGLEMFGQAHDLAD